MFVETYPGDVQDKLDSVSYIGGESPQKLQPMGIN